MVAHDSEAVHRDESWVDSNASSWASLHGYIDAQNEHIPTEVLPEQLQALPGNRKAIQVKVTNQ
jgi:hypothetical protein